MRKLAAGEGFAGTTSGLLETARVLDLLYGREPREEPFLAKVADFSQKAAAHE
ncbi:MAG TPA: hypothetical protein VHE36_02310 [Sphingomicrobium sp.]|nr:hypothetical protein [Sphingomicrobium sp.]